MIFKNEGVNIKKIVSPESEGHFRPTFFLSELSPKHRVAMDAEIEKGFKEFPEDINMSGLLFDAAILGYKRPTKRLLSRDLFDPRNVKDWRERLSRRMEQQLAYRLSLEAAICALVPEQRMPLTDEMKEELRAFMEDMRTKKNDDWSWKGVFWLLSNAKIVEPTENFLTDEDWDYIQKSLVDGRFRWMKNPEDALTVLSRIRIMDPSIPLPISKADWEKYKSTMDDPKHESIFGHVVLMQSAEMMIIASGGVEATASGIRLLPPVELTKSDLPRPTQKHI